MSTIKMGMKQGVARLAMVSMVAAGGMWAQADGAASFAAFDARATAGERLSVVFFGASLTWGANASDQARTSYRAYLAEKLETRYPLARFVFHDSAIGGPGSTLGVFRIDRDVKRWRPDLVFLDFSANDDIYADSPVPAAAYEAILRRLIGDMQVPVVQVIFPFRWNIDRSHLPGMKRRAQHLSLSNAYGTGVGDAIELIIERVESGTVTLDAIWPHDAIHPGDEGYRHFADAAWAGYEQAVAEQRCGRVPSEMLHDDLFVNARRVRFSELSPLPVGWSRGTPYLTALYYDWQMSRWMDDLVVAKPMPKEKGSDGDASIEDTAAVEPLRLLVRARYLLVFGEASPESAPFRVRINGAIVQVNDGPGKGSELFEGNRWEKGNGHLVYELASDLADDTEHLIEILPVFEEGRNQELRLESLCVAGGQASVRLAPEEGGLLP